MTDNAVLVAIFTNWIPRIVEEFGEEIIDVALAVEAVTDEPTHLAKLDDVRAEFAEQHPQDGYPLSTVIDGAEALVERGFLLKVTADRYALVLPPKTIEVPS